MWKYINLVVAGAILLCMMCTKSRFLDFYNCYDRKDGSDGAGASAGGEVRGTRDRERECVVVCTHNHFDHCGGAHHFNGSVLIHEEDLPGLWEARQAETLNYVKRARQQTIDHTPPLQNYYIDLISGRPKVDPFHNKK